MSNLLEHLRVRKSYIELKFKVSIQVSSITDDAFVMTTTEAVPTTVEFQSISLTHYNSISRVLHLFFEEAPERSGDKDWQYQLYITGLRSASGATIPDETVEFDYNFDTEDEDIESTLKSDTEILPISDYSIRREAFISTEKIKAANPYFYIESTDPESDSVWVDEDHGRGRVAVRFSSRPATRYLNAQYIKAQRKDLTKIGRWETLKTQVSIAASEPVVYVHFPSSDATPVYNVDGMVYFEDNYKYRVRLSRHIAPQEV